MRGIFYHSPIAGLCVGEIITMKNHLFVIFIFINLIILVATGFVMAGCYHDLMIMRQNNDSMRQSLAEMQLYQKELQKDMRQVKTDSDLVFRMVVDGSYMEEKE